jgi:hypothetical protein
MTIEWRGIIEYFLENTPSAEIILYWPKAGRHL